MEVFVRGSSSSAEDWLRAQQAPLNELPELDEDQKVVARKLQISEEDYARSAYAGQLAQRELLQKMLRFGKWLDARIQERDPASVVESVDLDVWNEKVRVHGKSGGEPFFFDLSEDLVERFLLTGGADLERAIFRVVEIFVLAQRAARAS
jgi:hypothetical protein